jgi:hypothetical protein
LKSAAGPQVTDVRWRGRGWGGAVAAGIIVAWHSVRSRRRRTILTATRRMDMPRMGMRPTDTGTRRPTTATTAVGMATTESSGPGN